MQLERGRLVGIALAVAVAAAVLLLWPREEASPEALIREKVEQMSVAAGERDIAFVMEQISESFRGSRGADKQQIKGIIVAQVFRGELVQVWPMDLDVSLESPTVAKFSGKFVFARKAASDVQAALAEGGVTLYRIDGQLEKESDDEWRFVTAEYQQLDPTDLF